jgi:hypothetical protein
MPPAPFSRQLIRLQFPKDVHFGDDMTVWISKTGDIARTMYLRVVWPSDAPTSVQPSQGTAMIDRVELLYKDQLIERLYGENIYMLQDVTVPQAKQSALTTLVGKNTTTALTSYHIPLPFFVLKKGLPLLALDEPPRFRIVFQPSTYKKPIDVSLFVEYVYVSKAERDWFTSHEVVYMTQTFQRVQFRIPVTPAQTSYTFYTDLVNDVKELFWVIQSDAASNVYDYGTTDQLVNLRLTFNGVDRITPDYATAQYLRVAQGLEFHTRVPDGRYYMYSFALEPEMDQPTGSVNMSQVTRQQHTLTLAPSASERSLRIYAMSYNLMRVKDGEATMLYTEREGGNVPVTSFPGGQVGTGVDSYIRGTDVVNSAGTVSNTSGVVTPQSVTATGGTITSVGGNKIHTFTSSGTFTVSGGSLTCKILVVAGGGGGGLGSGGGGGAGGLIYSASTVFTGAYTITVGNGGAGSVMQFLPGDNGQNSTVTGTGVSLDAIGGGGGGSEFSSGQNGGSGGGSGNANAGSGTIDQGNQGGAGEPGAGGGGGGAGNMGMMGAFSTGGNGGKGRSYSISGAAVYYAGGGGGSGSFAAGSGGLGGGGGGTGVNGTANTGGGGGANSTGTGGSGGSGIVIISYQI